jgi:hypothetical protein
MYRGRAVDKLAPHVTLFPPELFSTCPHENLDDPGRVHIDSFGNLHICQGLSLGNIFTSSIKEICDNFNPQTHPIIGPLLEGGPYKLINIYNVSVSTNYADACHLCYEARKYLRNQYPDILCPDQM